MEPKTQPTKKKPKHVHRMVSLPPELDEKASSMDNFSAYVRKCLEDESVATGALIDALRRRVKDLKQCLRIARDEPYSNGKWLNLVESDGWTWDDEE